MSDTQTTETCACHEAQCRDELIWRKEIADAHAQGKAEGLHEALSNPLVILTNQRIAMIRNKALEDAAKVVETQTVGGNKAPGSASRVLLAQAIREQKDLTYDANQVY